MYRPGPTAAELKIWGMSIEEATPVVEIWPDNVRAVNVFITMSTQWRSGAGGPTGLDYNVLYRKMDRLHLSESEYDDTEEEIRIMEDKALETMIETMRKKYG